MIAADAVNRGCEATTRLTALTVAGDQVLIVLTTEHATLSLKEMS